MCSSLFASVVILSLLSSAYASSTGYDMILTIVIVEVIFSFLIGVVCIILSFNLFRALKDSPDAYTGLPVGEFPLSRGASHGVLNNGDDESGRSSGHHSPNDREGPHNFKITRISPCLFLIKLPRYVRFCEGIADYSTFRDPRATIGHGGSFGSDAEMDFEGVVEGYEPPPNESNLFGVVKTVAGYLRLW
jgi:hypothetical protein